MSAPAHWASALRAWTSRLARLAGCDPKPFAPFVDVAASRPTPTGDGPLLVEWVAPHPERDRVGIMLFAHGGPDGSDARGLIEAGRACVASRFDASAARAFENTTDLARERGASVHVGLAWSAARGYRLKLFLTAPDLAPLRQIAPGLPRNAVALGFDVWDGGRYRERHYLPVALDEGPLPAPRGGHVLRTETLGEDAFGAKRTWSAIFPPGAALTALGEYTDAPTLPAPPPGFVASPTAFERDVYADGTRDRDVLVTLTVAR